MRKVLLVLLALSPFAAACTGEPETVSIRIIDDFESAMVQGSPPAAEPERTEWRFDGDGTIEASEEDEDTYGWTALNDVEGFAVRDGTLAGTTGEVPILLGVWPDVPDDDEPLYAIEVRMEAEANATILEIDGPEFRNEISAADESDLYTFQIDDAGTHIVETTGITDTFLTLFGPNSETTVIARDDDSGPGLLSRIAANLPAGQYFVRVRHFSPTGTGQYGLRIRSA